GFFYAKNHQVTKHNLSVLRLNQSWSKYNGGLQSISLGIKRSWLIIGQLEIFVSPISWYLKSLESPVGL
ncbi:hypothetical protein, partial [Providencia stuartii]